MVAYARLAQASNAANAELDWPEGASALMLKDIAKPALETRWYAVNGVALFNSIAFY
jgi:hypothetical protein